MNSQNNLSIKQVKYHTKSTLCAIFFLIFSPTYIFASEKEGAVIQAGKETFKLKGYAISRITDGKLIQLATFTKPVVSMLFKYRPHLRKHFSYSEPPSDIESEISIATIAGDKIWVGFSFYEGEGWEGFGGIGFYDTKTNETGVLRHPALIACSVKSLMVKDNKIYVATVGNYELSTTICNGLVVLDMISLETKAFVPPGNTLLWDKEEGHGNAAKYYDKPISEIIKDKRFIPKSMKSWDEKKRKEVLKIGLEHYMMQQAKQEKSKREHALAKATTITNQTVTLDEKESVEKFLRILNNETNILTTKSLDIGAGDPISFSPGFINIKKRIPAAQERLCSITGMPSVSFDFNPLAGERMASPLIYPPSVTPKDIDSSWMNAEKGKQWYMETSKYTYTVILEDFKIKNVQCAGIDTDLGPFFESVTFRVQTKKLAE